LFHLVRVFAAAKFRTDGEDLRGEWIAKRVVDAAASGLERCPKD
jgi:hypothetical protein